MRGVVAGLLGFVAFVLMPSVGVCADGIPPIEEGLKMVAARQQYALQRMGLSAELARRALRGAAYKPDSMCAQHVGLLLSDYDALHPEFPEDGPPDEMRREHIRLANSGAWRFVYDIEQLHICDKAYLDKPRPKPDYSQIRNPAEVVANDFRRDRQGTIDKMVQAGVERGVAENAAILLTAQRGRFSACVRVVDELLHYHLPNMGLDTDIAREMNGRDPDTAETDCDVGLMYQDPNAEDPYAPSIERLQKAFRDDRKGTIKKFVKAGVESGWAENGAELVLSGKGRYRRCAIIMGGLLDNMGYEWGDIVHHVQAINEGYYTIGGGASGNGGSGVGEGICNKDNMNQNPNEGLW